MARATKLMMKQILFLFLSISQISCQNNSEKIFIKKDDFKIEFNQNKVDDILISSEAFFFYRGIKISRVNSFKDKFSYTFLIQKDDKVLFKGESISDDNIFFEPTIYSLKDESYIFIEKGNEDSWGNDIFYLNFKNNKIHYIGFLDFVFIDKSNEDYFNSNAASEISLIKKLDSVNLKITSNNVFYSEFSKENNNQHFINAENLQVFIKNNKLIIKR